MHSKIAQVSEQHHDQCMYMHAGTCIVFCTVIFYRQLLGLTIKQIWLSMVPKLMQQKVLEENLVCRRKERTRYRYGIMSKQTVFWTDTIIVCACEKSSPQNSSSISLDRVSAAIVRTCMQNGWKLNTRYFQL